jgi:hypothetical protein
LFDSTGLHQIIHENDVDDDVCGRLSNQVSKKKLILLLIDRFLARDQQNLQKERLFFRASGIETKRSQYVLRSTVLAAAKVELSP